LDDSILNLGGKKCRIEDHEYKTDIEGRGGKNKLRNEKLWDSHSLADIVGEGIESKMMTCRNIVAFIAKMRNI
jgi:hypothetical protein